MRRHISSSCIIVNPWEWSHWNLWPFKTKSVNWKNIVPKFSNTYQVLKPRALFRLLTSIEVLAGLPIFWVLFRQICRLFWHFILVVLANKKHLKKRNVNCRLIWYRNWEIGYMPLAKGINWYQYTILLVDINPLYCNINSAPMLKVSQYTIIPKRSTATICKINYDFFRLLQI